jgi:hypothetical protein
LREKYKKITLFLRLFLEFIGVYSVTVGGSSVGGVSVGGVSTMGSTHASPV